MKKASWLKVVNVLLFIAFLWQAVTGFTHHYIPHEVYEVIHTTGGVVLVIMVIFHLTLNWGWIKNTLFKKVKP